jgi:uncharacterized membrane protein
MEEGKMAEKDFPEPTSEERIIVGFSYLLGWIPALIFWTSKKTESQYIRFHTMQAILFSVMMILIAVISIIFMFVIMPISMTGIMFGMLAITADLSTSGALDPDLLMVITPALILLVVFLSIFLFEMPLIILQLVNLAAAVFGFTGRKWRYPLLAKWAEQINAKDEVRQKQR